MRSEPPVGDDLQRLLVVMKQNVLERAEPRKRRSRRTWMVFGVVALLALGTAGGGVALGLIPTTTTAAPAPSASAPAEPEPVVTPSSAPVVDSPTPKPAPTPTAPPYSPTDWSTWTISADGVGPAVLGSATGADDAGLAQGLTHAAPYVDENGAVISEFGCPNPDARIWERAGGGRVVEIVSGGTVQTVVVEGGTGQDGPRTDRGIGPGSTLAGLRQAYPDAVQTRTDAPGGSSASFWAVRSGARYIVFQVPEGDTRIATVTVSSSTEPPYDYCS